MITLIVSDVHLGSKHCFADFLSCLLHKIPFDRLILNGDTIQNLNLKKLKSRHWHILGQLREIARQRELILIRGNHEGPADDSCSFGPLDVLGTLLGVEMREEFHLQARGRRYLVTHGDRFDPTVRWPLVTDAAEWCYHATRKLHKKSARWLKQKVKKLGGVVEFVKRGTAEYARGRGFDGVIVGHTHFPDDEPIGGIHYLNSGCWIEQPCHYILATDQSVKLHEWDEHDLVPNPELLTNFAAPSLLANSSF